MEVKNYKKDFPLLQRKMHDKQIVYLDNGATTQKPEKVIQAMCSYYGGCNANPHRGAYELSVQATDIYENARARCRSLSMPSIAMRLSLPRMLRNLLTSLPIAMA